MKYELVVRPEAELDILEAYKWYEDEKEGLGEELLFIIEEAMGDLIDRPLSCQVILGATRRIVLRKFPYCIFFTLTDNVVTLTSCVHQTRQPRVWMSRQ